MREIIIICGLSRYITVSDLKGFYMYILYMLLYMIKGVYLTTSELNYCIYSSYRSADIERLFYPCQLSCLGSSVGKHLPRKREVVGSNPPT